MTSLTKKKICILGIVVFIIIVIFSIFIVMSLKNSENTEFTVERWEKCDDEKRYQYIESLEEKYDLVGMKKEDIIQLLGNPSNENMGENPSIDYYEYRISDDIGGGWKVYKVNFENEIVSSTEVVWEDW